MAARVHKRLNRSEVRAIGLSCELIREAANLLATTNAAAAGAALVLLRRAYEPVAGLYLKWEHLLPSTEQRSDAAAGGEPAGAAEGAQRDHGAAPGANRAVGE